LIFSDSAAPPKTTNLTKAETQSVAAAGATAMEPSMLPVSKVERQSMPPFALIPSKIGAASVLA